MEFDWINSEVILILFGILFMELISLMTIEFADNKLDRIFYLAKKILLCDPKHQKP